MRKSQVSFLDFLLATLLSIAVLISIYSISTAVYRRWLIDQLKADLKFASLRISNEIIKAYGVAREVSYLPENFSAFLIYEKDLELPDCLKGRNYEIYLTSANQIWISITNISSEGKKIGANINTGGIKLIARTIQDPEVSVEINLPNIDVITEGKIESGRNYNLKYYRANLNGEIFEFALIGNYNILAKITNIR
ncbi:MAG: hypothetical protein QXP77_02150 [Candidatus Aenigmatarchaeota archaeon]